MPHDYYYNKSGVKHAREIFQEMDEDKAQKTQMDEAVFRGTMEDLLEKPEYIDSLESTSSRKALLAKAALEYARSKARGLQPCLEISEDAPSLKRAYMKNLCILSLSHMFMYTAFLSMRNLQSSINNDVGLTSLCVLYASLFISCIFTTSIVKRLRPRNTMLVCFAFLTVYVAANYYPHYYVLVPASAVAGFALANSYTAQATYLANIAHGYASVSGKSFPYVLTRFNGLYYMCFQLAQIIGGVISSVILMTSANGHSLTNSVYVEDDVVTNSSLSFLSNYTLPITTGMFADIFPAVSFHFHIGFGSPS